MNTSKYKATTVLTGEDFPPLSKLSTETFNPNYPLRLRTKIHCSPNMFARHKIAAAATALQKPSRKQLHRVTRNQN